MDILWFLLGVVIGFLLHRSQKSTVAADVLQSQVQQLNTEVSYYKDLCKWHVEEKEKLKRERYTK